MVDPDGEQQNRYNKRISKKDFRKKIEDAKKKVFSKF